jgi:hypothetical protein
MIFSGVLLLFLALQETVLQDFETLPELVAWDVKVEAKGGVLRVKSGHKEEWPGITLKAPKGTWDLSRHSEMRLDVANTGKNAVTVGVRVDSGSTDGVHDANTIKLTLAPGAKGTAVVGFERRIPAPDGLKLFGMRGFPGGRYQTIDPSRVNQVIVFLDHPSEEHEFELDTLRAAGTYAGPKEVVPSTFFPFIDEVGQYVHRDWPGKAKDAADLRKKAAEEDLAPQPKGWNRYGGWADGPQLKATGFFRTEKVGSQWWLVDPEGRLFWSHGIDCVSLSEGTPVEERDGWFRGPPARDSEFRDFFRQPWQVVHGHYAGRRPLSFDIAGANLFRKYGAEWKASATARTHARLRSWGMNTIGNWSDEPVCLERKTPYVVAIHFAGKSLAGSEGYWQPFRDVFDPASWPPLKDRLKHEVGRSAGDPWCLGYFVDNELSWGDETSLAMATLKSPADQKAKQVFVEQLREKHREIAALNAAWGTSHASWEALLAHRGAPDPARAREDLLRFNDRTAEHYFRTVRAAVKEIAPNQLYLGCRFAWMNPRVVELAAAACDVVSFNVYQRPPEAFVFPLRADKPAMITEFHFGATDRGPFHPGLVRARDQKERAAMYRDYVRAALRHPQLVGTHWFQYRDQPATGRELDGENYQVGFIDIADTPYPETVSASREVGFSLYEERNRRK